MRVFKQNGALNGKSNAASSLETMDRPKDDFSIEALSSRGH